MPFDFTLNLNYFAFSALLNVITSVIVGTIVYLGNRKDPINKTFALFAASLAAWSFGYFFWQISTTTETALFWARALMAAAIFISTTFLHFIFAVLGILKQRKKFLIISYGWFFLFFLANFTPYFVSKVEPALSFPFWPKPGILYHPFLIAWFGQVLYGTYLLIKSYRHSVGIKRSQIKYILFAMITVFANGSTNYFLWYNIPIPPIANILVSIYVIIIAYAVLKHHLFNIKVIASELLVGIVGILLFINIFGSQSLFEYSWKSALLTGFLISGYLLIKSVLQEVRQREELERLTNSLEMANSELKKLDEAKSEFISIASHQLRTPLTAVKGYISLVIEGSYGKLATKMKRPIQNVYTSNERLIRLVNDLLSISRIESGKMQVTLAEANLQDIIESVIQELQIKAKEKNIKIIFEKPQKSLAKMQLDAEKIRNVILNIIDNGIKYTQKGSITISASLQPKQNPKSVILKFKDTGAGMNKEELGKLFQSFTRGSAGVKSFTEGAGLGLYIAKQFVHMHNGTIGAESEGKNKGSTFLIELPIT